MDERESAPVVQKNRRYRLPLSNAAWKGSHVVVTDMEKENAHAENLAPRHNFFKAVDTKDYEYFADLNRHDEDMADVPDKGKAALRDLFRLSYQIGEQLRTNGGPDAKAPVDRTKTQGELYVRSKWLHTWKKRYVILLLNAIRGVRD